MAEMATKRLRLAVASPTLQAEVTVVLTCQEQGHWQATTAFEGVAHTSGGHTDERTAVHSLTTWLRERFHIAAPMVVQVRAVA